MNNMNNMQHGGPQQNQNGGGGGGSSADGGGSKTLWIGDVEPWMKETDVANQFNNIATVVNVKLIRDKIKGTPMGYGFVEFQDVDTAKEIFTTLNG